MNKTTKTEITVIIILLIIFLSSIIYTKYIEIKLENTIDKKIVAVSDINRFFSIDSSLSKYYSYIIRNNKNNLLKVLDKDYIKRNNISTNNILTFLNPFKVNMKSNLEEAYQFSVYKNIYKYYTKVSIKEETIYTSTLQRYDYFIVTVDENNLTFAIEPINENIYTSKIKGV